MSEDEAADPPGCRPKYRRVLLKLSGEVFGGGQIGVDPDDPLAAGFMLSDTWGEGF